MRIWYVQVNHQFTKNKLYSNWFARDKLESFIFHQAQGLWKESEIEFARICQKFQPLCELATKLEDVLVFLAKSENQIQVLNPPYKSVETALRFKVSFFQQLEQAISQHHLHDQLKPLLSDAFRLKYYERGFFLLSFSS